MGAQKLQLLFAKLRNTFTGRELKADEFGIYLFARKMVNEGNSHDKDGNASSQPVIVGTLPTRLLKNWYRCWRASRTTRGHHSYSNQRTTKR